MTSENQAAVAYPPEAAEAFNAANAAYRVSDFATALQHADRSIKAMPQMAIAHLMRARCLSVMDDLPGARAAYQAVLEIDAADFSAHLELGNILRRAGEVDAAEQSYRRAMDARPQDYRSHLAAAKMLIGQEGRGSADRAHGAS